eukprot:2108711-Prorocentrum_lima.AAC.1
MAEPLLWSEQLLPAHRARHLERARRLRAAQVGSRRERSGNGRGEGEEGTPKGGREEHGGADR